MPLKNGTAKAVISHNIGVSLKEGRPFKQALAIALRTAGKPKPAKKAKKNA